MPTSTRSRIVILGQTVITAHAAEALHPADVVDALRRHARGDWGEVCAADAAENELSITEGARLLSAYTDRRGVKFWIITEWDRHHGTAARGLLNP
jgi:hypothetical protein